LAEGHIQRCNVAASVSMAFGQKADAINNPWGDTPGYDEYGLRPLRPSGRGRKQTSQKSHFRPSYVFTG
ncbi:MAG: hypothetical protein QF437_26240, partial [Planctomycetota bacterium]|nr:hypothetical protein [Planctomycetota bacterium]